MNDQDKATITDVVGILNELLPQQTPRIAALIARQINGALEELSKRLTTLAKMEELDKQSVPHIAKNEIQG